MKCPADNETLQMSERQGVEIDYCPRCRGVWLDRGELDKIIERGSVELTMAGGSHREDRHDDDDERSGGYRGDESYGRRPGKRKRSFLSDMFEFGD